MKRTRVLPTALIALPLGLLLPVPPVSALGPCTGSGQCHEILDLGNRSRLSCYRTLPLAPSPPVTSYAGIKRALIVIHGRSRNAPGYFDYVVQSALAADKLKETIIVVPYFRSDSPWSRVLFWSGEGWREGEVSDDPGGGGPRMTSFHVIDVLLSLFSRRARFPDLLDVVVAGHSAGGQFTQRFAATSPTPAYFREIRFRFVVSAPGSYVYLEPKRWVGGRFQTPPALPGCGDWNRYKYGLEDRDAYVGQMHSSAIRQQYPVRDVVYLIGGDDTGDDDLDQSCEAQLQGKHRYRRAVLFYDFMQQFYPSHSHRLLIVPGKGHSARDIFNSNEGKLALFDVQLP
jgi:pimeloyl-ACP methyl ester carboxylesterase